MTDDDWRALARDLGGALGALDAMAASESVPYRRGVMLRRAVRLIPLARAEYEDRMHAPMPPALIADWPFLVWQGYRHAVGRGKRMRASR